LKVYGTNFTSTSKVWVGGAQNATTFRSDTQIDSSINGGVEGTVDVFVRDAAGDSNVVQFTFTPATRTTGDEASSPVGQARGRRR
jgi:hypothetical protein